MEQKKKTFKLDAYDLPETKDKEEDKGLLDTIKDFPGKALEYSTRGIPFVNPRKFGEKSLGTDILEGTKGLAKGVGTQIRDITELATNVPNVPGYLVGGVAEAGSQFIAGAIDYGSRGRYSLDLTGKYEDESKGLFSDMHNSGKYVFDKSSKLFNIPYVDVMDAFDGIEKVLGPAFDQRYESVIRRPTEILGEWVSPYAATKLTKIVKNGQQLKGVEKTVDKIQKELSTVKTKKGDTIFTADDITSFRRRELALKLKKVDKKQDKEFTTKLKNLREKEIQRDKLEFGLAQDRDISLMLKTDLTASVAASLAVFGIEEYYPEDADWMSPLAGILLSLTGPGAFYTLKSNGHALFANYHNWRASRVVGDVEKKQRFQDKATDHTLKALKINVGRIRDLKGNPITDKDELRKRKLEIIRTGGAKDFRRFEKFMEILNKSGSIDEQQRFYDTLERYSELYEKFRLRALKEGDEDIAESLLPMIHNVIELQEFRGIQATLLGNVDAGLFSNANTVFKNRLVSDLQTLIDRQTQQMNGIRNSLLNLKKLVKDNPEIEEDKFIIETRRMLQDAEYDLNGATKVLAASEEKTLGGALYKKLQGNPTIKLRNEIKNEIGSIQQQTGVRAVANSKENNEEQNILTGRILLTANAVAKQKADELYEATFKDADGNDIVVQSEQVINDIGRQLGERRTETSLPRKKFTIPTMQKFSNDLQAVSIMELSDRELTSLLTRLNRMTNDAIGALEDAGMDTDDAIARLKGAMANFRGETIDRLQKRANRSLKSKRVLADEIVETFFMEDSSIAKLISNDDVVRQAVKNTYDDTLNAYPSGAIKLKDLNRFRKEQIDIIYNKQKSDGEKEDAMGVLDALESFFEKLESTDQFLDDDLGQALRTANSFWASNVLPLRNKYIADQISRSKLFKAYEGQPQESFDDFTPQKLEEMFSKIEGTEVFKQLTNPVNYEGGVGEMKQVLRSILNNYVVDESGNIDKLRLKDFTRSFQRGILSNFNANVFDSSLARNIDDTFLNELTSVELSNGSVVDLFDTDIKYKDQLTKIKKFYTDDDFSKEALELQNNLNDELNVLNKSRSFAGTVLQALAKAVDPKESNPEKRAEALADTFIGGGTVLSGFRFQGAKFDKTTPGFKSVRFIENILNPNDISRFRGVLRGEAQGVNISLSDGTRVNLKFPKDVNTPLERAMYEIDYRIGLGGEDAKVASDLKDSINDLVISSIVSKSFKATESASLKTGIANSANKFLFDAGRDYVLDAAKLEESISNYMPYFRIALKQPDGTYKKTFKNPETGEMETIDLMQEFDDVISLSRSITKPIAGGARVGNLGMKPTQASSVLAKVFAWKRDVVGGPYLFGEQLLRQYKVGESDILKKFLTDPNALHAAHNIFVKGRASAVYQREFLKEVFSERTLAILYERLTDEDFGLLNEYFNVRDNQNKGNNLNYDDVEVPDNLPQIGFNTQPPIQNQLQRLGIG